MMDQEELTKVLITDSMIFRLQKNFIHDQIFQINNQNVISLECLQFKHLYDYVKNGYEFKCC